MAARGHIVPSSVDTSGKTRDLAVERTDTYGTVMSSSSMAAAGRTSTSWHDTSDMLSDSAVAVPAFPEAY